MSQTHDKAQSFYDAAERWHDELLTFRGMLLEGGLAEDFKWNSPCYTAAGGNVATVWALKDSAALAFFKGALLADPAGLLEAPGENSRSMRTVKVAGLDDLRARQEAIRVLIAGAIAAQEAGLKVEMSKDDLAHPDELVTRLDDDPALAEAFEALTPGRRRGYLLHFTQPKQSKTRVSRIEKAVSKIFEGKGMHDR